MTPEGKRTPSYQIDGRVDSVRKVGFIGGYVHQVDSKGRVAVPASWRKLLDNELIISIGLDGAVQLSSLAYWELQLQGLPGILSQMPLRDVERLIIPRLSVVHTDNQGRILIPSPLRDYSGLVGKASQAVLIGLRNRIELWEVERYRLHEAQNLALVSRIMPGFPSILPPVVPLDKP